ncbi:hypothetical protein J14TS2_28110 [Bacillus sp. J14TS2]|uniref:YesL family protein n=1 Tax=Bacillus sp. J14TS2 TaxID=2807188 RepID=UPI001B2D752A|nr:DUF624 domain-containing protein [Bacillus sp. J14TS2]GIN72336.1 hypothetical protein J14TS2_28110 [Bacillus sp. J14TS2]
MGTSGFMRGLYSFSVWAVKFVSLNALWLIMNIPIVFLVLNVLAAKTADHLLINMMTIVLLIPFILFPSITAMFGIVRQWIMGNTEIKILSSFWKYYRENYRRSLLGGLIIAPLTAILMIDYFYFAGANSPLFYIFLFVGVFIFVFVMHFFSNTVHVDLKFSTTLRNSFLLSVGSPVYTIGIAASSFIIIYLSMKIASVFIFLGLGSCIAYCSFYLYYKSQSKMLEQKS